MVARPESDAEWVRRTEADRQRRLELFADDPEIQEIIRQARYDRSESPEMDAEDIRIAEARAAKGISHDLDDVLREHEHVFGDEL